MQAARRYGRTVSGHTTVAGGGIAGPALARALHGTEIPVTGSKRTREQSAG
jgi:hypothetical protein